MLNFTDLLEEMLPLCYGGFLGKIVLLWDRLDGPISIKGCSKAGPISIKVCTQVINMSCLPEDVSISPGSVTGGAMFDLVGTFLGDIRCCFRQALFTVHIDFSSWR